MHWPTSHTPQLPCQQPVGMLTPHLLATCSIHEGTVTCVMANEQAAVLFSAGRRLLPLRCCCCQHIWPTSIRSSPGSATALNLSSLK